MTGPEPDALLAENRVCRIASISANGPHVAPLRFYWDGSSIWLSSVVRTQRWTDLQRGSRLAIVIDDGVEYYKLRGVAIAGRALVIGEVLRRGEPHSELLGPELEFHRKCRDPESPIPCDGRHAWLKVSPEKMTSWDFTKMRGNT